ncbi:MAG: SGNH/GDSL hydrolase family protein [Planctomycetes bacterium]|nr:SGNH/GDSL hydrolase family protein [Planctomycetota bacterium]
MAGAKSWRRRFLLAIVALAAAAGAAESGTRVWLHFVADEASFQRYASIGELRDRYGVFERFCTHRHLGFALAKGYRKGANRHNELGFRGDEIAREKPAGTARIVCCGGSTTYGEGVEDHTQSMPALLQQQLRADGRAVEVINAGCPGWTTLETLVNFETRVLDLSPDWIVVYHGINDVLPRMVWPHDAYRGDWSGWLCREEHVREASLLERSALFRVLCVRAGALEPHGSIMRIIGDVAPTCRSFAFRAQRNAGTYPAGIFRDTPVEAMLAANPPVYFERNLRSLLAVASAHGVRVLLSTFAFHRGWPAQACIGHPAVQAAIDETNEIVRRIGRESGTPVLDLAPQLVGKELFTDGVHFTVAGNRKRADLVAEFFRSR